MTAFKDWLNGLTSKTTPVDADEVYVRDSSGTPSSKKLTWANLKATLANTFLSLTGGTIASGTKTANDPALTVTQTWNDAGVTFAGKVTNITDTASASGSVMEDWQVGGVGKLQIVKTNEKTSAPALRFGSSVNGSGSVAIYRLSAGGGESGYFTSGDDHYWTANSSVAKMLYRNGSGLFLAPTESFGFGSTSDLINTATLDTRLYRDAAGTIAQRNGTSAQTFRLYNTYTDASNYERGFMRWNSNVLEIGTEAAGTGTARGVEVFVGTTRQAHYEQDVSVNRNWFGISSTGYDSGNRFFFNPVEDAVCRLASRVGGSQGAAMQFVEMTAPAAPATNSVRIYAEDNGSGKTRLMALFATGAAVQIAIEP